MFLSNVFFAIFLILLFSRLAPNYAEIARVLDEFDGHDFSPSTVLDYGSGIGAGLWICFFLTFMKFILKHECFHSGFWAVNERFGSEVKDYCMVDPSPIMTQFAMDIMRVQIYSRLLIYYFQMHFT